ncbi:unnamed protein product [Owenia fusiformis]|uniref:Uncharacterized protein n=1 Tax=Owenia fusiformis TaxID=6347 RepID=A0A8S4NNJ4_OWEFU|nr:unnamed protein product [Owenia fusiformis]
MPPRNRKRSPMKGHPGSMRNQHTKIVMLFNKATGGTVVNYMLVDEAKRILLPRVENVKFPMLHDVIDFRACVLNNCVYLLGGKDRESGEVLKQVLKFEPHTNKLIECPPMISPRAKFTATALDGRLYVAGGYNRNNKLTAKCESFEPLVNTWFKETSLPEGMKLHACVEDPKRRKLYLSGGTTVKEGCSVKMWELFKQLEDYTNPTSCWLWQRFGGTYMDSPALLPQGLRSHCMLISRDKLYVIGGHMKPTERQKLRILRRQNEEKTFKECKDEDKPGTPTNVDSSNNDVEQQGCPIDEPTRDPDTNTETVTEGADTLVQDQNGQDIAVSNTTIAHVVMETSNTLDGAIENAIPDNLDDIISIDSGTGLSDTESEHSVDKTQNQQRGDTLEKEENIDTDVIGDPELNIANDRGKITPTDGNNDDELKSSNNSANASNESIPNVTEDDDKLNEPIDYTEIAQDDEGKNVKTETTSYDNMSMKNDRNNVEVNGTDKAPNIDTARHKNTDVCDNQIEEHTHGSTDTNTIEDSTDIDIKDGVLNESTEKNINHVNDLIKIEDKDEENSTDKNAESVLRNNNNDVDGEELVLDETSDNIKQQIINLPKLNIMNKPVDKDKFQFRLDEGQHRLPTIIEENETLRTKTSKGTKSVSAKTNTTDNSKGTTDDNNDVSIDKLAPKKKPQSQNIFASQEIQAFELSSEKRRERETPWRVHWPRMSSQRVGAGHVMIGNKVYMIGGTNEDQESVHHVEYWHVKKREWTTTFSLPPGDYSDIDCCLVDMPKSNHNFKLDCSLATGRWVMW